MGKLIVSTWITIDGVFDASNMNEWFLPYDSTSRQNCIRDGILLADTLLLGRVTYDMLAPYWSSLKNNEMGIALKLNSMKKYVVSTTLRDSAWNNSVIIRNDLEKMVERIKNESLTEVQVEGSSTLVQSLSGSGLIDEYRFLVHPIVMGTGKRFFQEGMRSPGLQLTDSRILEKGVIQLCYAPA